MNKKTQKIPVQITKEPRFPILKINVLSHNVL